MDGGEAVDEFALKRVCVLILVHEDELEAALVEVAQVGEVAQDGEPLREQVVEVHAVRGLLARAVAGGDVLNLADQRREVVVVLRQRLGDGAARVQRHREDVAEHIGLRETRLLHVNAGLVHAGLEEILGVLAVEDGEVGPPAEHGGVLAEDAVADGVEGAAPEVGNVVAQQVGDTAHHLLRGLVREGE